ncbi:MAG TPA: hypothetical protein VMR75_03265 [Candidatus Saccharimonadales bacterium]|nr:hypothetical protein [Candidatus Saccharimonadales bacterium]
MKLPYHRRLSSAVLALAIGLGATVTTPAYANSVLVSQQIGGSLLSLSAPTSVNLSSILTNFSVTNTTAGSLGSMEVDDARGNYAGWSLTASSSNFLHIGQAVQTSGSTPTYVSTGGSYNSSSTGFYVLTITQGGPRGTAQFSVSGLENQTATTIPATDTDLSIGTRGIIVDFPNTTYEIGESWKIPITIIPASNLTIQPATTTARYGDLTGVHTGAAHTFSSTSDSATIMSADVGSGFGAYLNTPALSLQIPPLTPAGFYFATITETLS